MRPVSSILLPTLILFILFNLSGCSGSSERSDVISIEGTIAHPAEKRISVYTLSPFDEMIDLASAPIDPSGHFEMNISTAEPMEAYLLYGRNTAEIFLAPGFQLNIRFDATDFESSIRFKGNGAVENTFLKGMKSFNMEQNPAEIKTVPEFQKFIGTYKLLTEEKINTLSSGSNNVSDLFIEIQKNKVENTLTRYYSLFVSSYKNGITENHDLPDDFLNYWDRLALHNRDLLYSRDYRKLLNTYIADQSERNMSSIISEGDYERDHSQAEKKAIEEFLMGSADPEIREYVLASNISDNLEFSGFKKTKPDFDKFITDYPESRFTPLLKDRFSVWLDIDKGSPAPDFRGTTPDGDTLRLSDFSNKVIYLDVWASWCKPCLEEFPSSKKLKRSFSSSDNVVFMYVSIDDDRKAWLKRLSMDPDLSGVHLIVDNAWRSDFAEKYVVKDIPRYILIDRSGLIADIEADRPSSGEILAEMIRQLL